MKTLVVYVLFILSGNEYGNSSYGGPAIIDNIASKEGCEALGRLISGQNISQSYDKDYIISYSCHPVRKVK